MRLFKNISRYIVSLIMMFVLVTAQVLLFVNFQFLSPDFYIKRLYKTPYYDELQKEIDFGLKNLSLMTDVPLDVLKEASKGVSIRKLSESSIIRSINYMNYKIDQEINPIDIKAIREPLYAFADDYAKENNIEKDETLKVQIDSVVTDTANLISNHTILFNIDAVKGFTQFQGFRKAIYKFSRLGDLVIIIVSVCIIILFLLNLRRKRRVFLWIGSSMISSSLLTIIPAAMSLIFRIQDRLNIASKYLICAVSSFTTGYIYFFLFMGIALLIIGIALIFLYLSLSMNFRSKIMRMEQAARMRMGETEPDEAGETVPVTNF